jgi:hypothetical protein
MGTPAHAVSCRKESEASRGVFPREVLKQISRVSL